MADDELRDRALAAVEAELDRLRALGRTGVDALVDGSPHDAPREEGLTLTTRVDPEDDRLMVLVEAWRGRRMFATGGFAMGPDGQTHTPD
jgi:hypothetical protein